VVFAIRMDPRAPALDELVAAATRGASERAASWLREVVDDEVRLVDDNAVRLAFARAARLFGDETVVLGPGSAADWSATDAARAAVLLGAVQRIDDERAVALVETLYRAGELGEQVSVLRALAVLPDPQRFVGVAVEACRTNTEPVFRAIAHDHPVPARHFPALAFHQMVLKAIFLGVPVARIVGLRGRIDDELVRMVEGYASERRAAGRSVPDDVDLVLRLAKESS